MQPNSPAIAAGSPPDRRRKLRLLTVGHLDGRSLASKRARAIAAELEQSFGSALTRVQRQAIERAAMLVTLAEDLVARRLAGESILISDVLRAEGVAKRSLRAVLEERPEPPTPPRFSPMRALREAEAARKAQGKEAQREATEKAPPNEHATD
jgi:hypothetical protein